jgi:hypothetical protein
MLKSILINSLYVLSLVAVFFVIENRFEELEMRAVYHACIANENPIAHQLRASDWIDLCKLKTENEYNRSL